MPMRIRAEQHQMRRRAAHFRAGEHQPKMRWLRMFASHLQAMMRGAGEARLVAIEASVDAGLHVHGDGVHGEILRMEMSRRQPAWGSRSGPGMKRGSKGFSVAAAARERAASRREKRSAARATSERRPAEAPARREERKARPARNETGSMGHPSARHGTVHDAARAWRLPRRAWRDELPHGHAEESPPQPAETPASERAEARQRHEGSVAAGLVSGTSGQDLAPHIWKSSRLPGHTTLVLRAEIATSWPKQERVAA